MSFMWFCDFFFVFFFGVKHLHTCICMCLYSVRAVVSDFLSITKAAHHMLNVFECLSCVFNESLVCLIFDSFLLLQLKTLLYICVRHCAVSFVDLKMTRGTDTHTRTHTHTDGEYDWDLFQNIQTKTKLLRKKSRSFFSLEGCGFIAQKLRQLCAWVCVCLCVRGGGGANTKIIFNLDL